MMIAPVSLTFFSVPVSSSALACPAQNAAASPRPIIRRRFINALSSWMTAMLASFGPKRKWPLRPRPSPAHAMAGPSHQQDDFHIALYESGSGESDGLANSFFNSALIGALRFNPLGGIFWVNHLS